MIPKVRVRFAPSPTGLLHIGNARTALFNHIFARHHEGTFILRIEDTDLERSTEDSVDRILEDLRWLGISWQEGPDRGGPKGPYRQSQRLPLYRTYADQLLKECRVYKCFCSPERLESLRSEQLSKGKMPRYDGHCLSLSESEISKLESQGKVPVLRFHVQRGVVVFEDLIHGRMSFDAGGMGDFIILRSDGVAAYNFACVVDDHLMEVSHVIRGDDHLSNTPRQILLYEALGWRPPAFAHHPLILGPDRSPLSKRHGATAVSQYREEGFLPEALLNYLVLLGWTPPSGEEVLSLEQIVKEFSLSTVSRNAPIHSLKKLEWLNGIYLRQKDEEALSALLLPYLEAAGIPPQAVDKKYLKEISGVLKSNLSVLSQVVEYVGIFFDEKFHVENGARAILRDPETQQILHRVLRVIESFSTVSAETWPSLQLRLEAETGRKGKDLFSRIRAAVTGKTKGPELAKTLPLLGKERIVRRLRMALEIS